MEQLQLLHGGAQKAPLQSSTKLIVLSNNEGYFCASTIETFQEVIDVGRSTLGCFRRYANRSAKAFDGDPTISNHSAYR
ncbi:MAG: hypothetical protein WCA23_26700, partial [Stellaceae bacterium]